MPVQDIEIEVFDKDVGVTDDAIGKVVIPLDRLPNGRAVTGWLPVTYSNEPDSPSNGYDAKCEAAGAIKLSLRLDFKAKAELRGYVRGAVYVPPPAKPSFDVNALYGPGMLTIDLAWYRTFQPLMDAFLYVLYWENFIVSVLVMALWVPVGLNLAYWPSAMCFFLDFVMIYNYMKRLFHSLSHPHEPSSESKGIRLSKLPGAKMVTGLGKGLANATRIDRLKLPGTSSRNAPETITHGGDETPPDYEEQSLGGLVSKITFMSPGWLKEMMASYQPLARTVADQTMTVYAILHGTHTSSLAVFFVLILAGIVFLYVPFKYVAAAAGPLLIFSMSPLVGLLQGFVTYFAKRRRFSDPAMLGMFKDFDPEWMSSDAINGAKKKKFKHSKTLLG